MGGGLRARLLVPAPKILLSDRTDMQVSCPRSVSNAFFQLPKLWSVYALSTLGHEGLRKSRVSTCKTVYFVRYRRVF